ncbi:MAG: hypothetical protein AAFO02_13375 [Bacteroidota bacterium]
MRIFRYWTKYSATLNIEGKEQVSSVYGGSNDSLEDAVREAKAKLAKVEERIRRGRRRYQDDKSYEANILEEVIQEVDAQNIITRNRYGALVLNSTDHMFIDIDQNKRFMNFWDRLLRDNIPRKQLLQQKIIKKLSSSKYRGLKIRLYETNNGFRVIILNQVDSPRKPEMRSIMKGLYVDRTYFHLCLWQNCYRARLTPKPYRIKQKGIRVKYPERSLAEKQQLDTWVEEYEAKSSNFATCKLVYASEKLVHDKVIHLHDQLTQADSGLPLR